MLTLIIWWRWCMLSCTRVKVPFSHFVINILGKYFFPKYFGKYLVGDLISSNEHYGVAVVIFLFPLILSAFINWNSSIRKICPFSLIYLFIYLCWYGLKDIYFILWVIIQNYQGFFFFLVVVAQIIPVLTTESSLILASLSSQHAVFHFIYFWSCPSLFWYHKVHQAHIVFLALVLESTTLPRIPNYLYWRTVFRDPGVLVAAETLLALSDQSEGDMCIYILTHVYTSVAVKNTHTSKSLYLL